MSTLVPDCIREKTGIEPHLGLLDGAEDCSPDYNPEWFPNLQCSITFTTRGCRRNCEFCAVRKHEPNFFVKENWERDIDSTKNKIIFWDNNWLYSPNFDKDIKKLKELNKPFDFNQGLDCRLFDAEKAEPLFQTRISPLRFTFDNHSEEEDIQNIQKAIKIAQKYGFKDIRVYVLYNSPDENDTPEYFFYRINKLNKLGALSYPMRYRPIDSRITPRYEFSEVSNVLYRARDIRANEIKSAIKNIKWRDFEYLCKHLLEVNGIEAEVTKGSKEGGIDLYGLLRMNRFTQRVLLKDLEIRVIVQAKSRSADRIGEPELKLFAKQYHDFKIGRGRGQKAVPEWFNNLKSPTVAVFLTNAECTGDAYNAAKEEGIILRDGDQIVEDLVHSPGIAKWLSTGKRK
jgi:hypothetical protein